MVSALLTFAFLLTSQTQASSPPVLDSAKKAAAGMPRLHSLLVSHRGRVLLEYYASPRRARLSNVKSVSKSVIAALVGIAIERKLLKGVDQPIADFFPQLRKDPDPRKARISIEDLLTMRQGLQSTSFDGYGAFVQSRNWVQYVLDRPMESDPGSDMDYSTGSTHLLSAILTKATGRSTWEFAQEALGKPLGISFARWPRDPQDIYFGGNEMLMTPRQMLAFGELYLNEGRVKGRQVVPERWVKTSCDGRGRSRFNPDQEYGYGWWIREFAPPPGPTEDAIPVYESCFAWGYGGQYIFVFQSLDLVVVTTSSIVVGDERRGHRRMIFDLLQDHVLAALTRAPAPSRAPAVR